MTQGTNQDLSYQMGILMFHLVAEGGEEGGLPPEYDALDNYSSLYGLLKRQIEEEALRRGFEDEAANMLAISERQLKRLFDDCMAKIENY